MLFWLLCAGMTAAVLFALTLPMSGLRRRADQSATPDLEVYRSHLKELEADCARGLLTEAEAKSARIEASRRLLRIAEGAGAAAPPAGAAGLGGQHTLIFAAAALLVPLISLGLYLNLGSPGVSGQPALARSHASAENAPVAGLIAQVEARLRSRPEDGQGWDVIAPVYLRLERFEDAAQAFQRAIRILGESPRRLIGFGEATAVARGGVVVEEARRAFQRALELQPGLPEARLWLALGKEQDGDRAAALRDYESLLAEAPVDAPWREMVAERVGMLGGQAAAPATKGPTPEDVAAAEKMSPADRSAIIAQMVDGLATRLKANGKDLSGWQRLLRSYVALGRKQDALTALADARQALAGDAASLAALTNLARSLGLES